MELIIDASTDQLRKEYNDLAVLDVKSAETLQRMKDITETLHSRPLGMNLSDKSHMMAAFAYGARSYAIRRQVGAVVVKDDVVISNGYNGTEPGESNICESEEGNSIDGVIHAEINAISKIKDSGFGDMLNGSTLYVTDSPCEYCAVDILKVGIKRVVYCREYRITTGLDILKNGQVQVDRIDIFGGDDKDGRS